MIRTAVVNLATFLSVALLQLTTAAAEIKPATPAVPWLPPHDLLAHGSQGGGDDRFWIAHVQSVKSDDGDYQQTVILFRGVLGPWTPMAPILGRVVSMASSSGELLVVLDSGQWQIADPDDIRSGPEAPQGRHMLAIANDQDTVWAIVRGTAQSPNSTTAPVGDTTLPTTQPAAPGLIVCRFETGRWVDPQKLPPIVDDAMPPEVRDQAAQLSLAVLDGLPLVAWRVADGSVFVIRLTRDHRWTPAVHIAPAGRITNFKLLVVENLADLWVTTTATETLAATRPTVISSAGELLVGDNFSKSVPLRISGSPPTGVSAQTIALFGGHLRWLAEADDQPFVQQTYTLDGDPVKAVAPVAGVKPEVIPLTPWAIAAGVLILLVTGAAVWQRRVEPALPPTSSQEVKLRLAPLGVRLAAGLVDLLPILAIAAIVHPAASQPLLASVDQKSLQNLFGLATLTYLLHCAVAELICGQSIGKMLFGLRIIGPEGNPPTRVALLTRNLLRILDVSLLFVPLVLVLFSPLRQRVGDVAAGTVVIAKEIDPETGEEA